MHHLLWHWLGMDDPSGPVYLFYSGLGSDLGELAVIGGLIALYRRHNCHVRGCWHIGHVPVDGTAYVVCRRHHPGGKPTHAEVVAAARKANDGQEVT